MDWRLQFDALSGIERDWGAAPNGKGMVLGSVAKTLRESAMGMGCRVFLVVSMGSVSAVSELPPFQRQPRRLFGAAIGFSKCSR
ncbi:MAG: hypothetical protein RLZZ399_1725 [Verrucomicrobiota bacterium]|jgi:hypothetical protein